METFSLSKSAEGVDTKNPFITLHNGKRISVFNPKPEDIDIETIARGLSMQARYNGQCDRFLSVAEHCVNCSIVGEKFYSRDIAFAALLHDAAEAYVGDLIRPIKVFCDKYSEAEDAFEKAIIKKFNIKGDRKVVKEIDVRFCSTEMRDIFKASNWETLPNMPPAYPDFVVSTADVYPPEAFNLFMNRFNYLSQ
jgi:hypothetical protein